MPAPAAILHATSAKSEGEEDEEDEKDEEEEDDEEEENEVPLTAASRLSPASAQASACKLCFKGRGKYFCGD